VTVQLDGALTLVTGAGHGIGRATAIALAAEGARVIAADIDVAAATETADACTGARALLLDVTDRSALGAAAADIAAEHGALDVLVNNAGVGMTGHFLDLTAADWDWILNVNLNGVVNCCAAFGPAMVARGRGHVVNVASAFGYTPHATESAYCTSKAAVIAFSECLRADWHRAGVGVSVVCPGVINTGILERARLVGTTERERRRAKRLFARGRPPEAVAEAIVRAVRQNRRLVPVTPEAHVGLLAHRLLPGAVADRVARVQLR
jgi:NAD(P)-dependent dehydrogenase (short-subunit alcohol dehydrogenase family)